MKPPISIFWFRRDLRLSDNAGLYHALKSGKPVLPVFIFDTNILNDLQDKQDKRVHFIHDAIVKLHKELVAMGSSLSVMHNTPINAFKNLLENHTVSAVYTNHDYEPYAQKRDKEIGELLKTKGVGFYTFKDHVIFEKGEVVKDNGIPYTVFTPYSRKWKEKLKSFYLKPYPAEKYYQNFVKLAPNKVPSLTDLGFLPCLSTEIPSSLDISIAQAYTTARDFPAQNGTTMLGVHLRFGTISIRKLVAQVMALDATLLNELIWREFYQMILWHFPYVVSGSFKKEYDNIQWLNKETDFEAWCNGQTGYPIVDAGMRQLNETGYMHNRVRMVTASFLTKHLLVDWRKGEAYFAQKLLDYDLAANNGGWQWAAGSGCDAAPYFRVFNPRLQTEKFDTQFKYIKKWVPDYDQPTYPKPIVDHAFARDRCLRVYKEALASR